MEIAPYLRLMVEKNASDLFFSAGTPVHIKIEGETHAIGDSPLAPGAAKQLAYSIMNDDQIKAFEKSLEMNLAVSLDKVGRFRVNVYRQRGEVAMVVRYVKGRIPTLAELGIPPRLNEIAMEKTGLVLIVGGTGTGKSTTLAAMIDHRSEHASGHILTIEEPIEFVHKHKKSVVDQREIGIDTLSYANALKNAMREAPDVILIGEIRDRDIMQQAIAYAETGHLCLATLHANNAYQALERIIHFFPDDAHPQLFMDLSLNLKAVIAQRLLRGVDGKRLPAVEILLQSPYLSELIQKGEIDKIKDVMERSNDLGMQTLDQALFDLYKAGKISLEEALRNAESHNNLSVRIRLSEGARVEEIATDVSVGDDPVRRR
jgi:twitching motility protein PilU